MNSNLNKIRAFEAEYDDTEELYDAIHYSQQYDKYLKKKKPGLDVKLCDIVYGYTFSGDKWMNSVVRDKTKTIVFDDDDDDHPYIEMIARIKETMASKGINSNEITNNSAMYELYKILNNVILCAPPITKYENIVLYRGERTYADDLMSHDVDDTYVNSGIWSTSLDPYVAKKFAGENGYVIKILVPAVLDNGKHAHVLPIKDCSMEEDEFEILLPSGSIFLVIDKTLGEVLQPKETGPTVKKPAKPKKTTNEITLLLVDQPDKYTTIFTKG